MNIFVAKLNFSTESDGLREVFESYGEVSSCKVITDHFSGKSKGFAFVEMPNDDEARAAINGLNETEIDGRTIVVKEAEPRENRPRGGGGGGNGFGAKKPFNRPFDKDRKPKNFNRNW
jgi:RNA recognition motif-containing protein